MLIGFPFDPRLPAPRAQPARRQPSTCEPGHALTCRAVALDSRLDDMAAGPPVSAWMTDRVIWFG
jgi:hypothetical protein